MDSVMVDQEPHRSVQLIRRIDTRVPVPLLSQHIASTMGRLVDVRLGTGKGAGGGAGSPWSGAGAGAGAGGTASGSGSSGVGAAANAGTQGRWNVVATKTPLGTPRSGSTTPARVPSPAGSLREVAKEREGFPGPSRLAGGGVGASSGTGAAGGSKGVWVSPTLQAQRAKENAEPVGVEVGEPALDVPDNWEDDE